MKKIVLIIAGMLLLQLAITSQEIIRNQKFELVWSDEFDTPGAPDTKYWNHDITNTPANHELQAYVNDRKNSFVENGELKIRCLKGLTNGKNYSSARINSRNKIDFTYGRVEVRAKLPAPASKGTWPAIWMMPTNSAYGGWPASGEIDIMEHVGYDSTHIFGTVHTKIYNGAMGTQKGGNTAYTDLKTAYHVYITEWNTDTIKFFVDNRLYYTYKNDHKGTDSWPFNQNFYIILNIAYGGDWGGAQGINDAIFTTPDAVQMNIDYVRVYKKASDYSISGPSELLEQAKASFSTKTYNNSDKFQWILPEGVQALSRLDSNAISVNWSCVSDTIRLKVKSDVDSSINKFFVGVKAPKIAGKIWVDENATNVKYTIDSFPGATFNWTATEGISFPNGNNRSASYASFTNEGRIYAEVTTLCGTRKDSIDVKFGTGEFPYPDATKPAAIPGKIIAANFDAGGEGIAYHDNDKGNQGATYRTSEDVDIENFDKSYTVGWFDNGEWLKYTVNTSSTQLYKAIIRVACGGSGGKFDFFEDDTLRATVNVKTVINGDWKTFANLTVDSIKLNSGVHILKIKSYGGFNLGTMTFSALSSSVPVISNDELSIYPNPAANEINFDSKLAKVKIKIISTDGKVCFDSKIEGHTNVDVSSWARGVYVVQLTTPSGIKMSKVVLK